MTLTLHADPVPLRQNEYGDIHVGDSGVHLERVIEAYKGGADPATIVAWFDGLRLADVHAVLSYYLNHQEEVEEYLRERERKAEEVRRRIEVAQAPRPNFRAELLARQATRGNGCAAPGH